MKKISSHLGRVGAFILTLSCAPALLAAEETTTNEVKKLKPVIVTGSNIPTLEAEPIAPVTSIERAAIDRSGAGTVTEVLRKIPQSNGNGSFQETQSASFNPGSAAVSLRGLGAERTLVLLNGRRIAPYPFAQNYSGLQATFVDINSIPLSAVEKVDILLDTGSAIYGSDAIAGVVNLILRRDYNGFEVSGEWANTTDRDLFTQTYSMLGGLTTGKASLMFAVDYYNRHSSFLRDRPLTKFGFYSSAGPLGRVYGPDNTAYYIPTDSDGTLTAGDLAGLTNAVADNFFNTNPNIVDWPEATRLGGYTAFNYDITERLAFFVDGWYRNNTTHFEVNPTPIFGDLDGFTIGPDNPYNPFPGNATPFRWRPLQAGRRLNDVESESIRLLPGLRLKLGEDWNIETAFLYNPTKALDIGNNFLSAAALQSALNDTNPATALNPTGGVGYQNNQATIDGLKVRTFRRGEYDFWSYDIKANGPIFDLPAGPVSIALGGETRDEKLSDVPDAFSQQGLIVSTGGNDASFGHRDSSSLFAEVTIPLFSKENSKPLLRALELQAAGRFEYYSDFGTTQKPKVGLKWQPADALSIRASYSEGFRAPTLPELFTAQSVGFDDSIFDSVRCAYLPPDHPECVVGETQYRTIQGGNPNLKPENSESYFVGGSVQPPFLKGLTLTVNYSHIEITDVIANQSAQFIIDNPGQFPGAVIRGTPDPLIPGDPGPIISISQLPRNIDKQSVDSIDMGVNYLFDTDKAGTLEFNVQSTYYASFKRDTPEGPPAQYAGEDSFPKVRGVCSLFWTYKRFSFGPTANYTSAYSEFRGGLDPSNPQLSHKVGDWWTVDLQATYEGPWNTSYTIGILNIADENAPRSYLDEGYDNTVHDNRGRFVYGRFTKKF